jgi:hypothetical protein
LLRRTWRSISSRQVQEFVDDLKGSDVLCFVLPFKEIENLLLVPSAIKKVVGRHARRPLPVDWEARVEAIYEASLEGLKEQTSSNIVINSVEQEMKRKPTSNMHSVYTLASEEFRRNWEQPEFRRAKVAGKAAFSRTAKAVQDEFSVNLTETRVIDEMTVADVPVVVREIFQSFEKFFCD